MNKKGFTLIEMLIWLLVIGILLIVAISLGRRTFATSLKDINTISDEKVFLAAEKYINDGNVDFNGESYTCITTNELKEKGYLNRSLDINKFIEVKINKLTKVVENIYYVSSCN